VRSLIGALPLSRGMLRGLLAGVGALLAGLGVRAVLPSGYGALAAGTVVIAAVYVGAVLALGLSREDRMVLRTMIRRRTGAPDADSAAHDDAASSLSSSDSSGRAASSGSPGGAASSGSAPAGEVARP
jgi:uncharacterized membrane protein YedE/YeeE